MEARRRVTGERVVVRQRELDCGRRNRGRGRGVDMPAVGGGDGPGGLEVGGFVGRAVAARSGGGGEVKLGFGAAQSRNWEFCFGRRSGRRPHMCIYVHGPVWWGHTQPQAQRWCSPTTAKLQ